MPRTGLPGLVAVPVNEGRGGGVLSMHPQAAVEAIPGRGGGGGAPPARRRGGHVRTPAPAVRRHRALQGAQGRLPPQLLPRARLEDSKTISFDAEDWYEVLRFCHFVL